MTPGRYFPVGHQVGGHHLYDYLEEDGYSPLDAGRSSLTDLSSDLTPPIIMIPGVWRIVVIISITITVLPSLRSVAIILKIVVSV